MSLALLQICCLISEAVPFSLDQVLPTNRYTVTFVNHKNLDQALATMAFHCLVVFGNIEVKLDVALPLVLVYSNQKLLEELFTKNAAFLDAQSLQELPTAIDRAIEQFTALGHSLPSSILKKHYQRQTYSQRTADRFLRNLSKEEYDRCFEKLNSLYHLIILEYFKDNPHNLNGTMKDFVTMAFEADISAAEVLAIHMNLMDDFSKQLKLEGRRDEILADYRISLIDVIAQLCEMYRLNSNEISNYSH